MRAQRAALRKEARAELKRRRADLREQKKRLPRPERPRRRWLRRIALLIILLLLLLLRYCECDPPPPPPPGPPVVVEPEEPPEPEPPPPPPKKKPPPIPGRLKTKRRPGYVGDAPKKKTWLDDFRLQVAGRSLRLAACFEGVERPGAVRWVTSVDPVTGKVADHTLEPVARSVQLNTRQRRCVIEALANPPYRLTAEGAPPTPERVRMVLEF